MCTLSVMFTVFLWQWTWKMKSRVWCESHWLWTEQMEGTLLSLLVPRADSPGKLKVIDSNTSSLLVGRFYWFQSGRAVLPQTGWCRGSCEWCYGHSGAHGRSRMWRCKSGDKQGTARCQPTWSHPEEGHEPHHCAGDTKKTVSRLCVWAVISSGFRKQDFIKTLNIPHTQNKYKNWIIWAFYSIIKVFVFFFLPPSKKLGD